MANSWSPKGGLTYDPEAGTVSDASGSWPVVQGRRPIREQLTAMLPAVLTDKVRAVWATGSSSHRCATRDQLTGSASSRFQASQTMSSIDRTSTAAKKT